MHNAYQQHHRTSSADAKEQAHNKKYIHWEENEPSLRPWYHKNLKASVVFVLSPLLSILVRAAGSLSGSFEALADVRSLNVLTRKSKHSKQSSN